MNYNMLLAPGDTITIEFANDCPHELNVRVHDGPQVLVEVSHMRNANLGEEQLTYWFKPNE